MEKRELPEGREWTRLEDIISKIETTNPEIYPDKEFFYLDIDSIDNSQQKITNPKKILGSEAPSRARQIVKTGDILFSTVRTYLKNIALVEEQYDNQIASTGFCVIRPKNEVDGKFIFNYFQTRDFLRKLELLQRGANYPAVRESDILSQQIPLPPLRIQRQIVALLEHAEAVKRQRREADALTGALLQSVFYEMFGDPVRNEKGWPLYKMKKVCTKITDGTHDTPEPTSSGIPFIMGTHIRDRQIDFPNSLFVPKSIHDDIYRRCNPEQGDVILVHIGANLGNTAYINVPFEFSMKNIALLKPDHTFLDGRYLESYLILTKENLKRIVSRGGAQSFMSIKEMELIPCLLPPLALQQQFARIVESVERIRERQAGSRREIEGLFEGLMQQAVTGKLVA